MATLNISKTKRGWDTTKAVKTFNFLTENMNGPELCVLVEQLVDAKHITVKAANIVLEHLKETFKDID